MKRFLQAFLAVLLAWPAALHAEPSPGVSRHAQTMLDWVAASDAEAFDYPEADRLALYAIAAAPALVDAADARLEHAGMALLRGWYGRCCGPAAPSYWHIDNGWHEAGLREGLRQALAEDRLEAFLRAHHPGHPDYRALALAYRTETDLGRRHQLALNLARWRWMPRPLGSRSILVNIAARELTMRDGGRIADRRRVIVGKPTTRTPVFAAEVGGVVLNPWWDIPASIAREGIAALVRNDPAAARARGYIRVGSRYRQMPGDGNALGRMKLVMPNRFSVYLHDTSNRSLFEQDERLLSHGCVRVAGALEFAAMILATDGWNGASVPAIIEDGATRTIDLAQPFPIYVAYFTVAPGADGALVYHPDVYGRD